MTERKTALVTGSTSGIGLGVAKALAASGANVVMNGRRPADEVQGLLAEVAGATGAAVTYANADMTSPAEIEAMMAQAVDTFGAVDILVNNAGIQHVAPVDEFPPEKWDAVIATNLNSAFHCTRLALPGMKKKGWGRVVNIASAHSLVASPFKSAYVSAKHGLLGFTKTVALEVAAQGITCNAICPGYVLTPLVEKQIPATAKARGITEEEVINDVMLAPQSTKKFVTVEEIADLTVFLCSAAGASMTGTALPVDGGWTAH
ncbi:MAG: 3-hydroxybutyrate dehydrogenase [Minwuia sp.]|uniref:3-hydroxybutyrate dehydrogenase n=1 Tax=Minwuia sp. TaxID=2493630 RepID=UPI003A84C68B